MHKKGPVPIHRNGAFLGFPMPGKTYSAAVMVMWDM